MFGIWLSDILSPLFVLITFSLAAALSLPYRAKCRRTGMGAAGFRDLRRGLIVAGNIA
jgi:hypothetical protein